MPHAYTENQLVEQPAKAEWPPSPWSSPRGRGDDGLFAEYSTLANPHPCPFSQWEKGGRPAGLRVRSLVVLVGRLRAALKKLNSSRMGHDALPPEAIDLAASVFGLVSPAGERAGLSETAAVGRLRFLFNRLAEGRCKYLSPSEFVFEWKTSR